MQSKKVDIIMVSLKQRTILRKFSVEGVGIHTGKKAIVDIIPADNPNEGILFFDKNHKEYQPIKARALNVVNSTRCTVLGNDKFSVSTVEHFMATVKSFGIDNLKIYIDAPEMPILDGSAKKWCELFLEAGIKEFDEPIKKVEFSVPLYVESGNSSVVAIPSDKLKYTFIFDYPNTIVGTQIFTFIPSEDDFIKEVASARTFAFYEEINPLLDKGLAKGGDLSNALIIKKDGYMSDLNFDNEPVRHKCLDLIGDISLCGFNFDAHIIAIRSGHKLNTEFAKHLESKLF